MKRGISVFIAVVLIMGFLLTGCSDRPGNQLATSGEISSEATSSQMTQSTEPENVTAEPLSIETPAGAVLVGTIKKDSDGWYFVPEQTLNVTLNYYLDRPESFENQTRIAMFDNDGFNKNIYRDETVTVSGMLQNYRGAGTLYLYSCAIEHGKTVKRGFALPELNYPEEKASGEYDPSVPLPDKMQPTVKNGSYVYNPYVISTNTLERMGNAYTDFYIGFVDAWLSYETSCPCPEKLYADFFTSVMFFEFPLFAADGQYDMRTGYDSETQTLHWSYTSKNKAEHDRLISDFETAANAILKAVDPSDSEQKRAQSLYHAFCPLMDYDNKALETGSHTEPYYAYILNRGVCITFAGALSQLFNQIGIEGTIAAGDTTSGIGHTWNVISIEGKNYFCDATYELEFKNGSAYAYFGMTLKDRLADGSVHKDGIYVGTMNTYSLDEFNISETSLAIK